MLKIFINIYVKLKTKKSQRELFALLKSGDLVWAKMPLKKKELNVIEESHRIRPYLIVEKDEFYLYGFQTSSKEPKNLNNYEKYCVNKLKYNKSKDTWIDLNKVYKLPICNLHKKFSTLNLTDIISIEKRLCIQKKRHRETICFEKEVNVIAKSVNKKQVLNKLKYEVGTVFQFGSDKVSYLFYDENDNLHYGVDVLIHTMNPKVIPIYNIEQRKIVYTLDSKKCKKILEELILNHVSPKKSLLKVYYEIKDLAG